MKTDDVKIEAAIDRLVQEQGEGGIVQVEAREHPVRRRRRIFRRGRYPGGGSRGACGGVRRFDGSGGGVGNRGTARQPESKELPEEVNPVKRFCKSWFPAIARYRNDRERSCLTCLYSIDLRPPTGDWPACPEQEREGIEGLHDSRNL